MPFSWRPRVRRWGRLLVDRNRERIRSRLATEGRLLLVPRPPLGGRGHVEHYYHFLFDLVLPLSQVMDGLDPSCRVVLRPVGLFDDRIREIFGHRVEIASEGDPHASASPMPLVGMNPECVLSTASDLDGLRRLVFERYRIGHVNRPDLVVLVRRLPPDDFYRHSAVIPGGGAWRRSIPNHDDLRSALAEAIRPDHRLLDLRLETMPFREQLETFARTALLVGQHGAGLANTIWMDRGQTLLEISHAHAWRHFEFLCQARGQPFLRYGTPGPHSIVDPARLVAWARRQPVLRELLR